MYKTPQAVNSHYGITKHKLSTYGTIYWKACSYYQPYCKSYKNFLLVSVSCNTFINSICILFCNFRLIKKKRNLKLILKKLKSNIQKLFLR